MKPLALAVVLFLLTTTVAARTRQRRRRRHEEPQPRIVGGEPSTPSSFSFFVTPTNTSTQLCGGSLIHPEFVLTAAHCKDVFNNGVRVGIQNRKTSHITRQVLRQIPHENFELSTVSNDIMLLQLDQPINDIEPVSYTKNANAPKQGTALTVMGFGTIYPNGPVSNVMLQVALNAMSTPACQAQYQDNIKPAIMFCAGQPGKSADSCQGDSGGPIVDTATNTQVGIVSWGQGCGSLTHYGVYTRVGFYKDWIQNQICQYVSCHAAIQEEEEAPPRLPIAPQPESISESSGTATTVRGRIEITFDDFPRENIFYVTEKVPNKPHVVVLVGPHSKPSPKQLMNFTFDMKAGHTYEFTLDDTFGDGFEGTFLIYALDKTKSTLKTLLASGPDSKFKHSFSVDFVAPGSNVAESDPPQRDCMDNHEQFILKDCSALESPELEFLCDWARVAVNCPVTCGICDSGGNFCSHDDQPGTIDMGDDLGIQACSWLPANPDRAAAACSRTVVAFHCPVTCNTCHLE